MRQTDCTISATNIVAIVVMSAAPEPPAMSGGIPRSMPRLTSHGIDRRARFSATTAIARNHNRWR